ncbi:hypothetical protein ACTL6U_15085 [Rhodovibrionaceae bacterium A322]
MFGLPSLSKIMVLVGILVAVWYGFKLLGQLDKKRKAEAALRERDVARNRTSTQGAARSASKDDVEEMVACPGCGTYMPSNRKSCGSPDCPLS